MREKNKKNNPQLLFFATRVSQRKNRVNAGKTNWMSDNGENDDACML
jgi:hypothetical protein